MIYIFKSNFVKFVYSNGYVYDFISFPDNFCYAGKDFTVVDFDLYVDPQLRKDRINHLHQFHLIEQRVGAYDVGIALEKLAIPPLLRSVGPPHWLDLKTLERQLQFIPMHNHIACKRHRQVVPKPFLA